MGREIVPPFPALGNLIAGFRTMRETRGKSAGWHFAYTRAFLPVD